MSYRIVHCGPGERVIRHDAHVHEATEFWANDGQHQLDIATPVLVVCPKCSRGLVDWVPAPGQLVCEDNWGPHIALPKIPNCEARLSDADANGKRYLLVRRHPGERRRYFQAQLSCKYCQAAEKFARAAWNRWKQTDAASLPTNP